MKQWMTALLAIATLCISSAALAASDQEQKLDDATSVVRQFVDIPENAIPPTLLRQAHGIAVIPSVLKAGFILGGRHGRGVLSVRTTDGSWSNPSFISLTGGSIGWQAGVSSTDIILVFKTQRSIDRIASGQISLGADAAVAAGPVGRSAGASTNLDFDAEVYSYSRSRGLFAGVSLEGGKLGIDRDANALFYHQDNGDAYSILKDSNESGLPKAGQRFVYTLDRYLPAAADYDPGAAAAGDVDTPPQDNGGTSSRQNDQYGGGQATPYDGSGSGVTVQQGGGSGGAGNGGNNYGSGANSDY